MNGLILKIILNFIKLKFTTSKVMKKKILVFTGSRAVGVHIYKAAGKGIYLNKWLLTAPWPGTDN